MMIVIGAWILLAGLEAAFGFGIDVGGNDDLFNVAVRNDTSHTLTLAECSTTSAVCGSGGTFWVLKPRQEASTGQDPDGVLRPMEVQSRSKAVVGCMPFQFTKTPPTGTAIRITQMVPCGHSLGAAASGGRDWPFPKY